MSDTDRAWHVGPEISVIICTYNRASMLQDAIRDMISQTTSGFASFEVIVVDDGSTDGSAALAAALLAMSSHPGRLIRGKGEGIAAARNRGIENARGNWIAFFDDDQRAGVDWLRSLWEVADGESLDLVGGPVRVVLPPGGISLGRTARAIYGETDTIQGTRTPLPPGGNRLISRSLLDSLGPHDESFFTGGEDLEFAMRAQAHGAAIGWTEAATVYHHIPIERCRLPALLRYSSQSGAGRAQADASVLGKVRLAGLTASRLLRTLAATLLAPIELLRGHRIRTVWWDVCARISLTSGYFRKSLSILVPFTASTVGLRPSDGFRQLRS